MFLKNFKKLGDPVRVTSSIVFVRWLAVLVGACALTACDSSGSSNSGNTPGTPTPTDYTISGTVSGATAAGLVLVDNGVPLSVPSGATTFAYPVGLASGTGYAVSVQTSPTGLACTVANGSGTITANVGNIAVTCVPQTITVTLGGTISGLNASGLVLANNGTTLPVDSGATTFAFTSLVTTGTTYAVTVQAAPAGLTCSVANATGTAGTADISNVVVTCSPRSFTLGGSVSGLNGIGLVLANGTDRLSVPSGATSFTMPTPVASTSGYTVSVATQPNGLSCSVQDGTGTIGTANVTSVVVTCSDQPFTLGGTISGLNGAGLVLANGSDTLTVPINATTFTLPTPLPFASTYSVTVATQPAGLTCSVSSGATGTMPSSNLNNVVVVCSDKAYSLGGTITGLTTAGLVLANGTDTVAPAANASSFTFPTPVAFSSGYAVTITTQPTGLTCSVSAGTSTMPAMVVTTVLVTCSPNAYSLGGTIAGLTSSGLVLTDGTDQLSVAPNATSFTMLTALAFGSSYTVTVAALPVGELCTVTSGTGTIPAGGTNSVAVACSSWVWEAGADLSSSPSTAPVQGVYGIQGTPAAGNVPGGRDSPMTWTDSSGKFWMFGGTGVDGSGVSGQLSDLWMYDPTLQQWTSENASQTADAAGSYGAQGTPAAGNLPGARHGSMIWLDSGGHVWMFGGTGRDQTVGGANNLPLDDLWMYDPGTREWTFEGGLQVGVTSVFGNGTYGTLGTADPSNLPGARAAASTWTDSSGKFWMFGGVYVDPSNGALSYYNDVWVYDPGTHLWTWVSGTDQLNQNAVTSGPGVPAVSNVPGGRFSAASWQDSNGKFWLFGGGGYDISGNANPDVLSDLWMFDPTGLTWTLEGGSSVTQTVGTYGTQGTAALANLPGARGAATVWTDSAGQIWLFGGNGFGAVGTTKGLLNDLWNFNPTTMQWTWISGGQTTNDVSSANYGTLGTPAPGNQPGDRAGASGWIDSTGNLWMFGGLGYDSSGAHFGDLNDFWKF